MSLKVTQDFKYQGNDWWTWSIWIDGPTKELNQIADVTYKLHPTFANPVRTVTNRTSKFRLKTQGWGAFPINIKVNKKDGKTIVFKHNLVLQYPDGTPTKE